MISLVACFVATKYFYKALPEASIDFKITRTDSRHVANNFLEGKDITGYIHSTIFTYNTREKVFLERELGLDSANQIMGSQVRLWRWKNRYFKPLQKEEFTVEITTKGEIVSFEHLIKEEQEGAELTELEARDIAEQFIKTRTDVKLQELEFLTAESKKRPHRLDWTFTYKAFDIKDAEYRIQVTIQGNEVGKYEEFLKIPEKWTRDYEKLRSLNRTANVVANIFFVLIVLGMLFVFMSNIRYKNIRWKIALTLGIICFVLVVLAGLNILPLTLSYYETTASYGGFVSEQVLYMVLGALLMGVFILFITASSEPVYRESYKSKISLTNLFRWQSIRGKQFFRSTIVGLTLALVSIAYVVVFYIVAAKFGAWAPARVPYSDMLNTKIPAVFALLAGFQPAVLEELVFRAFAIAFCKRIFKSNWVAILLPAVIWGFLHSGYPQQPFYIRGIELTVEGILLGIIMLKFDILAVFIWHYTINAFYTAFLLLRSDNLYFVTSGAVAAGIMFIPLIICIICYIKTKGFACTDELTNERELVPKPEPVKKIEYLPYQPISYIPMSANLFKICVVIACISLCTLLLKTEKFGSPISYKVSKNESQLKADEFVKSKNIDLTEYKAVTFVDVNIDRYAGKYILDRKGIKGLNHVYGELIKPVNWCTRYFKPLKEEEYKIYVDPEGKVYTFEHIIAEADSGAELSRDSVLVIGANFLSAQGINLDEYELKEVIPEKRKARLDYTIIWEAKEGIDEAKLRIKLNIQGDEVSKFEQFIKVPEEWKRVREKTTGFDTGRMAVKILFFVGIVGLAMWVLIGKAREILWKRVIGISVVFVGLHILGTINDLPLLYQDYKTSIGLNAFITTSIAIKLVEIVGIFIYVVSCIALLTVLYPDIFNLIHRQNIDILKKDAIIVSLIGLCFTIGITQIVDFLILKFPYFSVVGELFLLQNIDTAVPFISYFTKNIPDNLLPALTGLGVVIHFIKRIRNPIYIALIAIVVLIGFTEGKTLAETGFSFSLLVLKLIVVAVVIKWVLRNNLLAYPLSLWVIIFSKDFYLLYTKSVYKVDGIILLVLAVFPIIYLMLQKRQSPTEG